MAHRKNLALICAVLIVQSSVFAAAPKKNKSEPAAAPVEKPAETTVIPDTVPLINLELNAGAGYRLFGEQVNFARDSLTPTPDYYVNYFYGARLAVQPSRLGVQAGFQRHLFRAASFSAGGGYSVYNYDTAEGGLVYLIPMDPPRPDGKRLFFALGGGFNYSMLQLADQFKSGLQAAANKLGQTLIFTSDSAKGFGGYAQGGILYYLNHHFFFSLGLRVSYINAKFSGATKSLDSWGLEVPFGIGVAF